MDRNKIGLGLIQCQIENQESKLAEVRKKMPIQICEPAIRSGKETMRNIRNASFLGGMVEGLKMAQELFKPEEQVLYIDIFPEVFK